MTDRPDPRRNDPREFFGQHPMLGPAYHPVFKGTATLLMMAIVFYAYRGLEANAAALTGQIKLLFAAAGMTMLFSYYGLLRSQTTIDGQGIAQSWMFKKPVAWDQIRSARVVRLPMAVRLLVRTSSGRFLVYHAGTEELGFAFEAIARRYPSI